MYPPSGGSYTGAAISGVVVGEGLESTQDFVLEEAAAIVGDAVDDGSVTAPIRAVLLCAGTATPLLTAPPTCSDATPARFRVLVTTDFAIRELAPSVYTIRVGYYNADFSAAGASPPVTLALAAGEEATCQLVAGSPGSAECPGAVAPELGTVVIKLADPVGGFATGFCLQPGELVIGGFSCSDTAPQFIDLVTAPQTALRTLAPGLYNAGVASLSPLTLGGSGPVNVLAGATIECTFSMTSPPSCVPTVQDDGDGVDEPPDFDGNGDGIADDQQAHVTSLPAAVGDAVITIAAGDDSYTLTAVSAAPAATDPAPPAGANLPFGVFGFTLTLPQGVTTADVDVILPTGTNPNGYYKLLNGLWVDFGGHVTISGDTITLHLTDGGVGDADGLVNGTIVDPGGPSVAYTFSGFFSPVRNGVVNEAKAGRVVPVKWRILDALGRPVSDRASFERLSSKGGPCAGGSVDEVDAYVAGASGLQYLGDGYWQYNWSTGKS